MASTKIEELKLDVEEMNKVLGTVQRQRVKDLLTIELRKLETDISNLKQKAELEQLPNGNVVTGSSTVKPKCYEVKLTNYAWDQSDKFVKIFVTLKDVQTVAEANVFCTFTSRSLELHVNGLDNRNYTLPIRNLLEEIAMDESYWKVKKDNVVVYLAKKKFGSRWSHITSHEKKAKEPKLPKMDKEEDPSSALMDMMRQMYEDGDDEMKRTIAKAWTEGREKQMGF